MPTRTRNETKLGPVRTHSHTSNIIAQQPPTHVRMSQVATMTDVVTPNFAARLKKGEVINNPCSSVKTLTTYEGSGYYEARLKTDASKYSIVTGSGSLTQYRREHDAGAPQHYVLGAIVGLGDAVQSARSQALSAVDKAPYAVAEDIATIRQTVSFLRRPFASISEISKRYERAKRGLSTVYKRGKRLKSEAQLLADLWLEYRFALLPLTRSVVNVIDSLNRPPRRYEALWSSHGNSQLKTDYVTNTATFSGMTYLRSANRDVTIRATVLYRVRPPRLEWQAKYGLRFKDLPELMWDLFPLSFMYDRVFDVGAAVRGLTNFLDPSVSIVGGCVTQTTLLTQRMSCTAQTHASYNVTILPDTIQTITESIDRSVWKPNILHTIPPVIPAGLIKDATSIADLSSLVLQRFR